MTSFAALHILFLGGACMWMFSSAADNSFVAHERELYTHLMAEYQNAVRPVANYSQTLEVKVDMTILNVEFLDEDTHTLYMNVYFRMKWNDFQLAWNPAQFNDINSTRISASLLWTPDLTIYNGVGDMSPLSSSHLSLVQSNGDVLSFMPQSFSARYHTNPKYFPYDKQVCMIKIGSWTYNGQQIDPQFFGRGQTNDVEISPHGQSGPFEIIEATKVRNEAFYSCCPGESYPDITYSITLQRRSTFATHLFLAPSVTLSLVIPMIFVMPVDSTERTTLGVGVLIAHVLLLGELIRYVPSGHELGMPIMSQFFLANIVLVTLTLVVSTAVTNLSSRGAKNAIGPGAVVQMIFLNRVITKILCITSPNDDSNAQNNAGPDEVTTSDAIQSSDDREQIIRKQERIRATAEWRGVAAVIDRLFLIAFFITVVVLSLCFLQYL